MEQSSGEGFVIILHRVHLREGLGSLGEEFVFAIGSIVELVSQWIAFAALIIMSFSCALYYFQSSFTFINVLIWYSSSL